MPKAFVARHSTKLEFKFSRQNKISSVSSMTSSPSILHWCTKSFVLLVSSIEVEAVSGGLHLRPWVSKIIRKLAGISLDWTFGRELYEVRNVVIWRFICPKIVLRNIFEKCQNIAQILLIHLVTLSDFCLHLIKGCVVIIYIFQL